MANVLHVFQRGDADQWMRQLIEARLHSSEPYTRAVVDGISGYLSADDKLGGSICKTITTRLQIWSNPRVAAATNTSDFDLRDIRRKKITIYVGVSPGDIPRNAPLLRLFFDSLINVNTSKTPEEDSALKVPALLLLDEFAQLGRMDRLAHALQYVRGYGMRIALVVQNRAQIMDVYGTYAATDVFDNVGCEMVYGTGDEKLADQLEKRMGDATVDVITENRPRWFSWLHPARQSEAQHPHRRPLMLRQEILQMSLDEQLILRPGMPPIRARKIKWYQEPALRKRRLEPPKIPQLSVEIPLDDGTTRIARARRKPEAPALKHHWILLTRPEGHRASGGEKLWLTERARVPTAEERITRWEQRQELIIASMQGMLDTLEVIRDTIAELASWLKEPPSSDLPDLIKALILRADTISDQIVQIGAKVDGLPAALAETVHDGHPA